MLKQIERWSARTCPAGPPRMRMRPDRSALNRRSARNRSLAAARLATCTQALKGEGPLIGFFVKLLQCATKCGTFNTCATSATNVAQNVAQFYGCAI